MLFAKLPEPGRVKTRLAAAIGPEAAAELAAAMLADAAEALGSVDRARPILCADGDPDSELFRRLVPAPWRRLSQGDGDLGERLTRAFARELALSTRAAAFGADHPLLATDGLSRFCDEADALWPAEDGGYAAILLTRREGWHGVFERIPWSTRDVAAVTRARAKTAGIDFRPWPATLDVDRPEDLAELERRLSALDADSPGFPRATAAALAALRAPAQ